MRVIKRRVLAEFGERHPEAGGPLETWYHLTKAGRWEGTADVKRVFGISVDFVANNRAIFDIKDNDCRLIGEINYRAKAMYVRFLGTREEYDRVDAATVKLY